MTDADAKRAAHQVCASVLAAEVQCRLKRFGPDEQEAHAVTAEMQRIVTELRKNGVVLVDEEVVDRPKRNGRKRPARKKDGGKRR